MSQHEVKLGSLITSAEYRDAIHIAVAPVVAGQRLQPGQHVAVKDGKAFAGENQIGIVDPFLQEAVQVDERFWLCLYPRTIATLRHEWSHPAFNDDHWAAVNSLAAKLDVGPEKLMKMADGYATAGIGSWWPDEEYNEVACIDWERDFWTHWSAIRGTSVNHDQGNPFECNC